AVVRDGSHQVGTLVWHWDGNHWDDLPTPDPPAKSFAFFASPSVTAFSATDAWLIGFASLPTAELTTAAVHWDGLRWTRFPTPEPGVHQNVLQAVAGSAPDDVWAGGYWTTGSGHHSVSHSLLLHFDGHAWTQSPAPDSATGSSPVPAHYQLAAAASAGPGTVWFVGDYVPPSTEGQAVVVSTGTG